MRKQLFTLFLLGGIHTSIFAQALNLTVSQVAGTCATNAQINAAATGGSGPYQFRLTAGATGIAYPTAWQSGTNFSGLKPGTYTVEALDNAGAVAARNITVTTSYVSLNLSNATSTANHCPLNPNGSITATVTAGRTPYSYRLLQGSIEVKPAQAGNKFTEVKEGNYTVEVTDACGEIRTRAITVALNDFKWRDSKNSDNDLVNSGYSSGVPANAFDTTKMSNIYDGPLLFTCDSIAFRIFNTLEYNGNDAPARSVYRRVYIKELSSGSIVWDNTFRPSDWPGGYTSPSVRLKINTDYRFYFDDLCNDIDSVDRNYNYANTNNYSISTTAQKICGGFNLVISRPSNWNTKNRYNNPYDTITIINSTLAGDTTVGKSTIENFADKAASQPLIIQGITPGNTYTIRITNSCTTYVRTVTINSPGSFSASIAPQNRACKINTASLIITSVRFPTTPGNMVYRINSGPASFTDIEGITYAISYPIIDSFPFTSRYDLRNFPEGTYSIDFFDQCGNMSPTMTITVTNADVLKISGSTSINQQCNGASSITYNNLSNQNLLGSIRLYKKDHRGIYLQIATSPVYTSATMPSKYTFSALADGDYRVSVLPSGTITLNTPIASSDCDILFTEDMTLAYKLPLIDTADGYVCTPGGNDGRITLHGKDGAKPYEFQRVDGSGNPLSPYQSDSLFTGLTRGLHNFRIKDNCGNATLFAYFIDTLKKPGITPDSICYTPGSSIILHANSIEAAAYTWTFSPETNEPASTIGFSGTLALSNLNNSNWGRYTVSILAPGCTLPKTSSVDVLSCFILSVKVESFTAAIRNSDEAILRWKISGNKIMLIEIQKSTTGLHWQSVGSISGLNQVINDYTFGVTPNTGSKTFYRLKITDFTGQVTYSNIIGLDAAQNTISTSVYPNPAAQVVHIKIPASSHKLKGMLYNTNQQLVLLKNLFPGINIINTTALPKGHYTLSITDGEKTVNVHKIIIKK
ncbi:MAG TPA: T9SS type A sorting domain-containing protein [Ferruginibacter sp.]|nr:T9SS type A sorting domain-containing protein [Ferruginibacter sp.]HMP21585.1 T9SS type A sorting domain-containing protein [Ferruginibacter sp.]